MGVLPGQMKLEKVPGRLLMFNVLTAQEGDGAKVPEPLEMLSCPNTLPFDYEPDNSTQ